MKSSVKTYRKKPSKNVRLFLRFIKEKGIYRAFLRACIERASRPGGIINSDYNGSHIEYIHKELSYEYDCDEVINHAFCWSETREGHNFWSNYDDMWRRIICDGKRAKYYVK